MSEQPRLDGPRRATRVFTLGEAVPLISARTRAADTGGKPARPEGKTAAEIRAEEEARRDAQPTVILCAFCGWRFEGTAGDGRLEAAVHRTIEHPELAQRRPARRAMTRWTRDDRDEREREEAMTLVEQRREAAHASERRLLGEAAVCASGDVDAASPSSPLEDLEREPRAAELRDADSSVAPASTPAVPAAAPSRSSTTTTGGRPMRRWTRDTIISELQAAAAEVGGTPTSAQLSSRGLGSLPAKKFLQKHGFESFRDLCHAAGLQPNRHGWQQPPAPPAAPLPEPKPELPPAAAVALRDPIRTADIPYDADILEDEAEYLERRAGALRQIAQGIRNLAGLNEERAA